MQIKLNAALSEVKSAKEAATHEESKAENKYDTRGLEATYIAQAQAKRASEIKEDLYNLSKVEFPTGHNTVSVGHLVQIFYSDQNKDSWLFLLPSGGASLKINGQTVKTISPKSPLGQLLIGKQEEESFLFRREEVEIKSIK